MPPRTPTAPAWYTYEYLQDKPTEQLQRLRRVIILTEEPRATAVEDWRYISKCQRALKRIAQILTERNEEPEPAETS